jgi:hypothetical protein
MTRFERWTVWVGIAAVVGSGVAYGILRYLLATTDEWGVASHPLEPVALKLHVLSAPLLVFAVGLIAVRHILDHLRQGVRPGRRSGLAAVASVIPMIASGYAIQVVTDERWLVWLAWVHGVTGAVFAVGAVAHVIAMRLYCRPAAAARANTAERSRSSALATPSQARVDAPWYDTTRSSSNSAIPGS